MVAFKSWSICATKDIAFLSPLNIFKKYPSNSTKGLFHLTTIALQKKSEIISEIEGHLRRQKNLLSSVRLVCLPFLSFGNCIKNLALATPLLTSEASLTRMLKTGCSGRTLPRFKQN